MRSASYPVKAVKGCISLALSAVLLATASVVWAGESTGLDQASLQAQPPHRAGLDARIKLLTAELALDTQQQVEVRRLLMAQRENTLRVWNDENLAAPLRVQATQKISQSTADQIRALLTEDQRKKYIQPNTRKSQQNFAERDLEAWMQGKMPNPQAAAPRD